MTNLYLLIKHLMEREIHRLQKILADKEQTIKELTHKNGQLLQQLNNANNTIQNFKDRASQNFEYENVPDRQIIQTLETKLAASAWQILQLQKINMKYEQNILRLQSEVLSQQQQLQIRKSQVNTIGNLPDINYIEDSSVNHLLKQWQDTIRQKQILIEQNFQLKQKLRAKEDQLTQKMSFYLNEVINLSSKLKNQYENQKTKLKQIQMIANELKKQNNQLKKQLNIKNQQILLFYQQSKMITSDKASDMHTIRNLRNQLKKKGQQFFKILAKLKQTQEIKKQLVQYNQKCSQSMGEFSRIFESYEKTKQENGILKQKMKKQQNQKKAIENLLQQNNKKLYELLIENQACHQLLYEARGYSQLFMKDIEAKVERFLQKLQKRRENYDTWVDVSQLIAINQKLRVKQKKEFYQ